ncbi:MAG: hypothetical protein LBQ07_02330 [Endomicrobium sp.]|jgi:hypothetical protein|nr:hypothetical protein [Endomicrobium sp.]
MTKYNPTLICKLKEVFETHKGQARVYIDLEDFSQEKFSIETKYLSNCSSKFVCDIETITGSKNSIKLY